uniref:Uncharacterized protein n=1 Tax=Desulfacinum infernum TaxID=35837 RepID=A0A832A7A7_9BACT
MWIFTEDSFLSVVRHRDDPERLLVRARIREDLERFCRMAGLDNGEIHETPEADYRFRVEVPEETFINFMVQTIKFLDYDNFKNRALYNPDDPPAVRRSRAAAYHDIWLRLLEMQHSALSAQNAEGL